MHINVDAQAGGTWRPVGVFTENDPMGSVSSTTPDGRRVFLFGWRDGLPGVWESHGADITATTVRIVMHGKLDLLADLTAGEHTMPVWLSGREYLMRFVLRGDGR